MKARSLGRTTIDRGEYAERDDFVGLFESERPELQRLALLLTANRDSARRCLDCAFHDCVMSDSVSRQWIHVWARRMVIRNAIAVTMEQNPQPSVSAGESSGAESSALSENEFDDARTESESILALPHFERFVFVLSALERYSLRDCALLLGRSLQDVSEAKRRVGDPLKATL